MIVRGAEQIEFFTRFEPTAKGPPIYFLDKVDALAFLKRLFMNAWDRSELRDLLDRVPRTTLKHLLESTENAVAAYHKVS